MCDKDDEDEDEEIFIHDDEEETEEESDEIRELLQTQNIYDEDALFL